MATLQSYYNSFPSVANITFVYSYSVNPRFFVDLYRLSEEELKTDLLAQSASMGSMFLPATAHDIFDIASVITGDTDAKKWVNFKNYFPVDLQPTIEVIINYYRDELSLSFDDFVDSEADFITDVQNYTKTVYNFWSVFVKYIRYKANVLMDEWVVFENSLSEGPYKKQILWFDETVQQKYELDDLRYFKNFIAGGPEGDIVAEIIDTVTGPTFESFSTHGTFLPYLSLIIKEAADRIINGFGTPEEKEEAFYANFRTEFQKGIKQFITDFINRGFISEFIDLKNRGGQVYAESITVVQASSPSLHQVVNFLPMKADFYHDNEFFDANHYIKQGDKIILKLNNTYLTHTFTSDDFQGVNKTELINAINDATGDWSDITASADPDTEKIRLTHSTNDVPFTFTSESVYDEVKSILVSDTQHAMLLSLAQAYYNDATSRAVLPVEVTKVFTGQLIKQDPDNNNIPLIGYKVRVSDAEDPDNLVLIGVVTSNELGYFSISYKLKNAYTSGKKLRIEVLDASDNGIKIVTSIDPNLFTDADYGTFEHGTAPDYSEWNLDLGADIEIRKSVRVSDELLHSFSDTIDGWYRQTGGPGLDNIHPFDDVHDELHVTSAFSGDGFFTTQPLIKGKKYRISFESKHDGDFSPTLSFQFSDHAIPSITLNSGYETHEFEFVYNGPYRTYNTAHNAFFDASVYFAGRQAYLKNVSVKEVISNAIEGDFSPEFYLDGSTPSEASLFSNTTFLTLQADKDYELSAYVFFKDAIVEPSALTTTGIYLAPLGFSFSSLIQVDIHNGARKLEYMVGDRLRKIEETVTGTWRKITTKFNSGATTSIHVGVSLKGTLGDFAENFSVAIDKITLTGGQDAYESFKDILIDTDITSETVKVYVDGFLKQGIEKILVQVADASHKQKEYLFPVNVQVGDLFVLDLNHKGIYVYYKALDTIAENVVTGLTNAINTAGTNFEGSWPSVGATDYGYYVQVEADNNNTPFTLIMKVIRSSTPSITLKYLTDNVVNDNFYISNELYEVLSYKGLYTLDDIVAFGGLKNNIDGQLIIKTVQQATVSLPQITHVTPVDVEVGDIFRLKINNFGAYATFVATAPTVANVVAGLVAAVNALGFGPWDDVTAANGTDHIIITHNSNNTAFTLIQNKLATDEDVKQLDSYASLFTIAADTHFPDQKKLQIVSAMIEAGFENALDIANVSQADFVKTIYELTNEFNAARLYQVAKVRTQLTHELVNQYFANSKTFAIGSGKSKITQMKSLIGERCSCDDCEAAVSPLAYLVDLSNYVSMHLYKKNYPVLAANGSIITVQTPIPLGSISELENMFYQNFSELPASCEDIKNLVCQVRICIEVVRRYLNHHVPAAEVQNKLDEDIRIYFFKAYRYLLEAIGTSYDEIRVIRTDSDKQKLADKLGVDFAKNPDFLDKLYVEPTELSVRMPGGWNDYKKLFKGTIQVLLDNLITTLGTGVSPVLTTPDQFYNTSTADLKTKLSGLVISDDFLVTLGNILHDTANSIPTPIMGGNQEAYNNSLWQQYSDKLIGILGTDFSMAVQALIRYRKGQVSSRLTDYKKLAFEQKITDLKKVTTVQYDFWTPFINALKYKVTQNFVLEDLSEKVLEEIFGLVDTSKDIFSDGAKSGDVKNYIERWNIRGVEWGQNTDELGYIYLKMVETDDAIELHKNSNLNDKVGVANLDPVSTKFIISEFNDSGLSGDIIINTLEDDYTVSISVIPLYLSWQLQSLRENWLLLDGLEESPVIDPDIIEPGDIKFPYDINTGDPSKPVDFWQVRRTALIARKAAITDVREDNNVSNVWGTMGSGGQQLSSPTAVVKGLDGKLYISDTGNNRIQRLNLSNSTFDAFIASGLNVPKGLLFDAIGNLMIADSGNDTIKLFNSAGSSVWSFGATGSGLGQFSNPTDLLLDTENNIFIADTGNNKIKRFTLFKETLKYIQTSTLLINIIAAADTGIKQVSRVTPLKVKAGETYKLKLNALAEVSFTATAATIANVTAGLLYAIQDPATDWDDVVSIVDNGEYLEFTANSTNTAFTLTSDNSIALQNLAEIAADREGNFIVPDKLNHRLLKLDKEGNVLRTYGNPHQYAKSLITMLRFDDGSGSAARDSSGNTSPRSGTVQGSAEWVVAGRIGGALNLDGTDDSVTIANDTDLNGSDQSKRTVELWFKVTSKDAATHQLLFKQGNHEQGMSIYVYASRLYVGSYGLSPSAWSNFISTKKVQSNTWHHVAVVFNSRPATGQNKFRAFIDGVEFFIDGQGNSGTTIETTGNSADLVNIGGLVNNKVKFLDTPVSSNTTGHYTTGAVDQFRIWNRALDNEEIKNLYSRQEDLDGSLFIPGAVTIDIAGNLYVADKGNARIVKYDVAGSFLLKVGRYGVGIASSEVEFRSPSGIGLDSTNNIYVTDDQNHDLQSFNQQGILLFRKVKTGGGSGSGSGEFNTPFGIAIDKENFIYVTDTTNNRVQVFDAKGNYINAITSLSTPKGISIDRDGHLLIVFSGNNKIVKMTNTGTNLYEFNAAPWSFTNGTGIAVDPNDYFYLICTESGVNKIKRARFPIQYAGVTLPKGAVIANTDFSAPKSIALDKTGNLIISDAHDRLLKMNSDGVFIAEYGKNGSGEGEFNEPYKIVIDESGNIYVADSGNDRVQKFNEKMEFLTQWNATDIAALEDSNSKGLWVDENRKVYVTLTDSGKLLRYDSTQGVGAAIAFSLGGSLHDFLLLQQEERAGEDISDALELLHMENKEYRQLLKLLTITDHGTTLVESPLNDLYNILVNIYKKSNYSAWKAEEKEAGITLSPDFFVLRNRLDENNVQLVQWRASQLQRRDWRNTLDSRIEQESNLWIAHEDMVKEAEDALLLGLRDSLIVATDFPGGTLEEKAQSITDRLLIDAKNNCCQRTTRVSQAFETLQGIMFGVRNGLVQDDLPDLLLTNYNTFDDEWIWMGSYATWRSAQFVFMYPENLLLPSYKKVKSGGFADVVNKVRSDVMITPHRACEYANDFFRYLKDLNTISLVGAVNVNPFLIDGGDCDSDLTTVTPLMTYMVGYSNLTKLFYMSSLNPATNEYQLLWQRIPELDAYFDIAYVGGRVYLNTLGIRKLYLFFLAKEDPADAKKLFTIAYNLNNNSWESEVNEIDFRAKFTPYDQFINVNKLYIEVSSSDTQKIRIFFSGVFTNNGASEVHACIGGVNDKVDKLDYSETSYDTVEALGGIDGSTLTIKIVSRNTFASFIGGTKFSDYPVRVISIFKQPATGYIYIFFTGYEDSYNIRYSIIANGVATLFDQSCPWYITNINYAYVNNEHRIILQSLSDANTPIVNMKATLSNVSIAEVSNSRVKLNITMNNLVPYNSHKADYSSLRDLSKVDYLNNASLSKSIFNLIEEYQYFVPMLIATALQRRGLYQEALGWYRMVYDYTAKTRKDQSIYYGLYKERLSKGLIADYDSTTDLVLASQYSVLLQPGINNPDNSSFNKSAKVALFTKTTSSFESFVYAYDDNLNQLIKEGQEPDFKLDILESSNNNNVDGTVLWLVPRNAVGSSQYYGIYTAVADVSKKGKWQTVSFVRDTRYPRYIAKEQIKYLEIYVGYGQANRNGHKYYLDNIRLNTPVLNMEKPVNWLNDPIDPHGIAANRPDAYSRYTITAIARCLQEFADNEYTQDTAESVPRARQLYQSVLEMLSGEGMETTFDKCSEMIEALKFDTDGDGVEDIEEEWRQVWILLKADLYKVKEDETLEDLLEDIKVVLSDDGTPDTDDKLKVIRNMINSAIDDPVFFEKITNLNASSQDTLGDMQWLALSDPTIKAAFENAAKDIATKFEAKVQSITGVSLDRLLDEEVFADDSVMAQLRDVESPVTVAGETIPFDKITGSVSDLDEDFVLNSDFNPANKDSQQQLRQFLLKDLKKSFAENVDYRVNYTPQTNFNFCVPPNPVVVGVRFKANLNLFKIRNCMNIAGTVREINPFAAPIDAVSGLPQIGAGGNIQLPGNSVFKPTIYRYEALIERAKQLVQVAQQVEASMLATLEKLDVERYSTLKAKQDLSLAKAGVKLQDLRVTEAQDGIKLAELQKDRTQFQYDHFNELIAQPISDYEQSILASYDAVIGLTIAASAASAVASITGNIAQSLNPGAGIAAGIAGAAAAVLSGMSSIASTNAQIFSTLASFERRTQEWEFQRDLANKDIAIAGQQVTIAQDQLRVVGQERQIAQMQVDNADATIDFLKNKFTNAELYDWMSGVLEGVYAFFLQQATVMAKQASNQLAFERQQFPPDFIKSDYWEAPVDNLLQSGSDEDKTVDRKGLTGSVRLLQDIYQLDQFAFTTDKRKLELSKTISLSTMAPAEFQRFKETGDLPFETRLETFDRDFPGHYLRLIKRIRVSLIALIPVIGGMKATLSNTGVSYIVIGGDTFQRIPTARDPELVGLTSTSNATGLFEFTPIISDKLLPFENTGVESRWLLSMPKASNFFDYSTIADILVTIEYTALYSNDYKAQLIQELDPRVTADLPFSFRNRFADQWYDLNNPELTATPMKISFTTSSADFPNTLKDIRISQLLLYFVKSDQLEEDDLDLETINKMPVLGFTFTPKGKTTIGIDEKGDYTTGVEAAQGMISTRKGAAALKWSILTGAKSVEGTWTLEFPQDVAGLFKTGKITDMLLVVTYEGTGPEFKL